MGTEAEKSGVHLTGRDSGWPVGSDPEPEPKHDGTGADEASLPDATAADDGVITTEGS